MCMSEDLSKGEDVNIKQIIDREQVLYLLSKMKYIDNDHFSVKADKRFSFHIKLLDKQLKRTVFIEILKYI